MSSDSIQIITNSGPTGTVYPSSTGTFYILPYNENDNENDNENNNEKKKHGYIWYICIIIMIMILLGIGYWCYKKNSM
jgi:hypothetical protein